MKVVVTVEIEQECHKHPRKQLVITFRSIPTGATITMPTTGTPVSLTQLTSEKTTADITAIDQSGNDITSTLTTVTAASDNSDITVVQGDGPLAFDIGGVVGSPATGTVTFSDPAGDIVVINVTTSDSAPPVVTTLVVTLRPTVSA